MLKIPILTEHPQILFQPQRIFRQPLKNCADVFVKTKEGFHTLTYSQIISDFNYRSRICNTSGIPGLSADHLQSIAGPEEIRILIKRNNNNRSFYLPGERPESKKDIPDSYLLENVINKRFGASLHVHTNNSDGKLSTKDLLNLAAKYADEYAKVNNEPFVIGITDHNTIEGCKEAVRLIAKKPKKYKNLKVVLGTEISTKEHEINNEVLKKPAKFHILSLFINPFDKEVNSFFGKLNEGRKNPMFPIDITVKEAVDAFKNQKENLFSLAHPAYPNIKKSLSETDNHYEKTIEILKHFKDTAGDKAFYAENYYAGYYGDVALDEKLHKTISKACDDLNLLKAGGIDTHGKSIFYNGVKELKANKKKKK